MSRLKRRLGAITSMSQAELVWEWSHVFRAAAPALPADLLRLGIAHALLKLLRKAMDAQTLVLENPAMSLAAVGASQKMDRRQLGRLVKPSWLSPSIIERIHAGDIPHGLTRSRLLETDLPLDWGEQERVLGFC